MTQHSDSQYDDDLTVGMDKHESFSTDSVNLFEFTGDDESPIARLKTIILSIDWEINDDILHQLEEELLDLNDVWAGDKIKQVYIQGLDKIGKYIYKEKASSHPNAIKLLLTFYYNLEKIVSSEGEMSLEDQKAILVADVKKFDQLKSQIGDSSSKSVTSKADASQQPVTDKDGQDSENPLHILKARVLGIDWEINDHEMQKLSEEVKRLEGVYSQSKAKLILLQGLGALGSYINTKRSQSNATVFSLLHSFYDALEKITISGISAKDEKRILLAEVQKFNAFKADIAKEQTETSAVISDAGSTIDQVETAPAATSSTQKVSAVPSSEAFTKSGDSSEVASDVESRLASVFGDEFEEQQLPETSGENALAGVDVETEADDDSDEEALPFEGDTIAPALADAAEESSFSVDILAEELAKSVAQEVEEFDEDIEDILQGVDVETEADDDSDEDALPMEEGAIAPALSSAEADLRDDVEEQTDSIGLEDRLDSFFGDEIDSSSEEWGTGEGEESLFADEEVPGQALEETSEPPAADITDVEEEVSEGLSFLDEETPEPALAEALETPAADISDVEEEVSAGLSFLDEETPEPALAEAPEPLADITDVEEEVSAGLSFLDEETPEPALEEAPEPLADITDVEEEVSAGLSFLDEETPEPALAEAPEPPADITDVAEEVSAGLSFLDEETPEPALAEAPEPPAADITDVAEEVSAGLSFLDEETPEPALAEATETSTADITAVEEEVSAGLSFLDEETPGLAFEETPETAAVDEPTVEEEVSEGLSFLDEEDSPMDVSVEEATTEEEIQFTVPGEELTSGVFDSDISEKPNDDIIEFRVPGEEPVVEQPFVSSGILKSTDVIFEAVEDDVDVDPLPREDLFSEKTTAVTHEKQELTQEILLQEEAAYEEYSPDISAAQSDVEAIEKSESDLFTEVEQARQVDKDTEGDTHFDNGEFVLLKSCVDNLQGEVTNKTIQALLQEVDTLRNRPDCSFTEKIFLQLLASIGAHLESCEPTSQPESLELLQKVSSALELSASSTVSVEQVQEELLECTGQVLFLQQNIISKRDTETDALAVPELESSATPEKEKALIALFQDEMTQMRQTFHDEINTLRKELSGRS